MPETREQTLKRKQSTVDHWTDREKWAQQDWGRWFTTDDEKKAYSKSRTEAEKSLYNTKRGYDKTDELVNKIKQVFGGPNTKIKVEGKGHIQELARPKGKK